MHTESEPITNDCLSSRAVTHSSSIGLQLAWPWRPLLLHPAVRVVVTADLGNKSIPSPRLNQETYLETIAHDGYIPVTEGAVKGHFQPRPL